MPNKKRDMKKEEDAYGDYFTQFTLEDGFELRVYGGRWAIRKELMPLPTSKKIKSKK